PPAQPLGRARPPAHRPGRRGGHADLHPRDRALALGIRRTRRGRARLHLVTPEYQRVGVTPAGRAEASANRPTKTASCPTTATSTFPIHRWGREPGRGA